MEKFDKAWNELLEIGVEEQAIEIVCQINGSSVDTLRNILYAYSGERRFDFEFKAEEKTND